MNNCFTAGVNAGITKSRGRMDDMRVLVVEDNERIRNRIQQRLTEEGFLVDAAKDADEGEEKAAYDPYDAIVLDLLLGDRNGIQICKTLRQRKISTPILMLTALSATQDKVTGLEAGADDYLTKPFEFDELVARVRALLRRAKPQEGVLLTFEDVELDLRKRIARRAGKDITLTAREFALLEYFMRNPDRVLTRSGIGEHVWDMNFYDESNVIEVYVSRLRNKLNKHNPVQLIHTVPGSGYILSADRGSPSVN